MVPTSKAEANTDVGVTYILLCNGSILGSLVREIHMPGSNWEGGKVSSYPYRPLHL
jgi:hypothetical protein